MRKYLDELYFIAVAALIVGIFAIAVRSEDKLWQAHAAERHCQASGVRIGDVSVDMMPDGSFISTSGPDRTVYACDGGEIDVH